MSSGLDENWTETKGVGKLTRRAYNQLVNMYNERLKRFTKYDPSDYPSEVEQYRIVSDSHRDLIDFRELIVYDHPFVNMKFAEERGGDFTGLDGYDHYSENQVKYWHSEDELLDYIGDEKRVSYSSIRLKNAEWNWQTLRMLDALQWMIGSYKVSVKTEGYFKYAQGVTDEEARSNWANADFVKSANLYPDHYSTYDIVVMPFTWGYIYGRRAQKITLTNAGDIPVYVDVYAYTVKLYGYHFAFRYEDNDYGHGENKLFRVKKDIYLAKYGDSYKFNFGFIDEITASTPGPYNLEQGYSVRFLYITKPVWKYSLH